MTAEAAALERLETFKMVVDLFCISKQEAEANTRKAVREVLLKLKAYVQKSANPEEQWIANRCFISIDMQNAYSDVEYELDRLLTQYQDQQLKAR